MSLLLPLPVLAHASSTAAPASQSYRFGDGASYTYARPTPFGWLGRSVRDVGTLAGETTDPANLGTLGALLGGTVLLVHYDQDIYDETRQFGSRQGISQDAGGSSFTGLPRNFGNYLYFIGDGRVPALMAAGFLGAGYYADDIRMQSVASQLAEILVSTGMVSQGLKQALGRETPESRTKDGGEWHGPQNLAEYTRHETSYDAMPSGHLATAVAALTVLAENYPEHSTALWSGGSVLMGLLAFQMVNNGVHWAGDYPFGAAIGYALGEIAADGARIKSGPAGAGSPVHLSLAPGPQGLMVAARATFD